jgi:hypothetical protein
MNSNDRWDIALLIYTLAGIFVTFSGAAGLLLLGLLALIEGDSEMAQATQATVAALLTMAVMGIPALVMAIRNLFFGRPASHQVPRPAWYSLAALLPLGLALGWLGYDRGLATWFLGPLGQVLAVGAPAGLLLVHMRRIGPPIRSRRAWGHFLLGLWAVPFVTIILEAFLLVGAVILGAAGLSLTAAGRESLRRLQSFASGPAASPESIPPDFLRELALNPAVLIVLVGLLGVAVPITEELLKTASVWPLLRNRLSSAEAFLGGALGGTGFALSEALFLTQPAAGWLVTAVARSGATLMHALATAIAAWGLAEGLKRQRWSRTLVAWLLAISMHGLWNLSAIAVGVSQLAVDVPGEITGSPLLISGIGLTVIVALSTAALVALPRLQILAAKADSIPGPDA